MHTNLSIALKQMKEKTKEIVCDYIAGEVWKPYDNYFVSNYGRVYSCVKKGLLKQEMLKHYTRVAIGSNKNFKHMRVHRLVAMLFINNPEHKPIVHHIDGNSFNNKAVNLMWVTSQEHYKIHNSMRKQKEKEDNKNE